MRDGSGGLVQRSEQFAALQQRGAAQHRHVHLTVVSRQLRQQVGLEGGPQQATGHTWNTAVREVMVLRSVRALVSSHLFSLHWFCSCFYVNMPQTTSGSQVSEQTCALPHLKLLQGCHTNKCSFSPPPPNFNCSEKNCIGADEESCSKRQGS